VSIRQAASDNRAVKTLRLSVDPGQLHGAESRAAIQRAAEILRAGGLVALPTETVYGLGANALDSNAVARIFVAKQRPAWDPVIVHIAGPSGDNPVLKRLVAQIPQSAIPLMETFWPGPLTLLLPRSAEVPDAVTAGRPLVGVRMPAHPAAFELIQIAGIPVAAPSANVFGHTSPTTAEHVLEDLDGRIDAVLDAGPTLHGVESTVLDPNQSPMIIYRPGAVTAEQIREIAGPVEIFQSSAPLDSAPREALPSPGVGLRHYAPHARLTLVAGSLADLSRRISEEIARRPAEKIGVMLPAEVAASGSIAPHTNLIVFPWGRWADPQELARNLYAGLRALDARGCSTIICPMPPAEGVGMAIHDRLIKAAR
jgi:L-threonylcarbamoyladenylate synthase